jgi:hypothetical protein
MKLPVLKGILFAALFVSGATFLVAPPAPVQLVAGILLAYVLPGFVLMLFIGEPGRPVLDDLFFSIILSPIVLVLLVLAFHAGGSPLEVGVRASSLLLLALLAIGLIKELNGGSAGARLPARTIVLTCAGFGGIVLATFLANRFLLVRSDAWYHGTIVSEILDRGIPPKEPLLPDVPIRYMWIYHLFVASTGRLTGLSIFPSLALFNIMSAFAFPYLAFRFTARFTTRRRDLIATPIFAVSGLASAAWILWPLNIVKAFGGGVTGRTEVLRLFHDIHLNSIRVVYFLSPFEKMSVVGNWIVNVVDKFVTITPFAFTLDIFVLMFIVAASIEFERRFPPRAVILSFIVLLGALLYHVVAGLVLVLTIVGAGMLLLLNRIIRRRGGLPVFHAAVLPVAAVAAAAAAFPYLRSLTGGSGANPATGSLLHIGLWNIVTIALPLLILYRPATSAIREIFSLSRPALTLLASWVTTLLVLNVFVDLPHNNESKLVYFLFCILFPPIVWRILDGIEASRARRRVLLVAWTGILFAVPPLLTFRGAFLDRPSNRIEERRYEPTADDRLIEGWISSHTPPNSVVIESTLDNLMPVDAHRRDFFPDLPTVDVFGYRGDAVGRYRTIQEKFLIGEGLTPDDMTVLGGLEKPVYVVLWQEDIDRTPRVRAVLDQRPEWFELVYQNAGGRVYFVRGT